jgi:hypothetical protein
VLDEVSVGSFETGIRRLECARPDVEPFPVLLIELDMLPDPDMLFDPDIPLDVEPLLDELFRLDDPLPVEPDVPTSTSPPDVRVVPPFPPDDPFMLVPPLPLDGAQLVALVALVPSVAMAPLLETAVVRLPVVVVSAPTPAAPFVAFRPVNR